MSIHIIWHSVPDIGYFARTATKGEEYDLVMDYVRFLKKKYEGLKCKNVAIFVEPQIESGYPDLVIIEYYNSPTQYLKESREKITHSDLKILMEIQLHNSISLRELSRLLGYSLVEIEKSISLLKTCGLVHLSPKSNYVRKVSIRKWCRISRIIAVEAKIDKWADALFQAQKNLWFATDSYILINKNSCSDYMRNKCKDEGIGIVLSNGSFHTFLRSSHATFPLSYASLQFNEWIQRLLLKEGVNL